MTNISSGTENDIEVLNQFMIEFNLKQLPFPDNPPWKTLCYVCKEDEALLGGVYGYLMMNNILKIDVLYVVDKYRHQGYGKKLLECLEKEAKHQKAYLSMLDTYDFQARAFYQKNGYEIFGTLDNCPAPGHQRYSLRKELAIF